MAHWGLIPERVETLTCVTCKRNKHFDTPLGGFSYRYLRKDKFSAPGVRWIKSGDTGFFLATPERALADKVYLDDVRLALDEVPIYLEQDLRLEMDESTAFDPALTEELAARFQHPGVRALAEWLR